VPKTGIYSSRLRTNGLLGVRQRTALQPRTSHDVRRFEALPNSKEHFGSSITATSQAYGERP